MGNTKTIFKKVLVTSLGLGIMVPLAAPNVFAQDNDSNETTEQVVSYAPSTADNSSAKYFALSSLNLASGDAEENSNVVIEGDDEDPEGENSGSTAMGGSTTEVPSRGGIGVQATSVMWETIKKEYKGVKYGSFKTLVERSSGQSGSITISFSKTRANSFTGELKVPKVKMDNYVGFDIKKESNVTVNDVHEGLKKNKSYLAQYRTRNKVYEVTQQRVTIENWTGQVTRGEKKVLTIKKQDGYNTRVYEQ